MSAVTAAYAAGRTAVLQLLTDRCDVVTPAKGASDGRFGWAAGTAPTTYSNIPCLIDRRNNANLEEAVQQRLQGRSFATIHLETTRTVTMGQRIDRLSPAETYQVIGNPTLATNGLTLEVPAARNT